MTPRRRLAASIAVLCALAAAPAVTATAEVAGVGNLRVKGTAAMQASGAGAPTQLAFAGSLKTVDRTPPPTTQQISFVFSSRVGLELGGLPRCTGRLAEMSAKEAIETCGDAKVGAGTLTTSFRTPELEFSTARRFNAYYGSRGGRPAILAQVLPSDGLLALPSFVVAFMIENRRRGVTLTAKIPVQPQTLRANPTVSKLEMNLGRRYRAGSGVRSVVDVNCQGAQRGLVPLVDIGFGFSDGTEASVLTHGRCVGR